MKLFNAALPAFMAVIFPTIFANQEIPDRRYLKAYTEFSYEGPFQEFEDYVPDLSVYSLDNAIKSICWTGFWFLYGDTDYEGEYMGDYYHNINRCQNLSSSNANKTSSLRYAGSPVGINDIYYNLYDSNFYRGAEFKGNTNAPSLGPFDQKASSLVINGQSPWTFFTGPNYTGMAACVYPEYHVTAENNIEMNYYYVETIDRIGLPYDSIRSVAKGCYSDRIFGSPLSEASHRLEGEHEHINTLY